MSEKKYSVPIIYEPFKETVNPPFSRSDQVYLVLVDQSGREISKVRCIYSKISNREKPIDAHSDIKSEKYS